MKPTITTSMKTRTLLLDGGMGTALMARGLAGGQLPELWNLERPDVVREVHAAYVAAGSDVVQTNTFGGNDAILSTHGLAARMEEINAAAVRLATEATAEHPGRYVAGNIGPSGGFLPPVGDADPDALEEMFSRQAAALASAGADYISIETMSDLREALCALRAARQATRLPVTVCLTYQKTKRGFFTLMGTPPGDAARALADAGADAIGANCSIASDLMIELCPTLAGASGLPVIVKPNAGMPELDGDQAIYRQEPEAFARDVAPMAWAGAAAVGGCCGTDERFIAALRDALVGGGPERWED